MIDSKVLSELFAPRKIKYDKLRLGCNRDGGYIMFNYGLDKLQKIYSYGIGNEITFENELIKLTGTHCISYLYDHTIEEIPPLADKHRMLWFKQPATSLHLPAHINFNGDSTNNFMALKMDIECDEWEILKNIDATILGKFYQIIIELHFVQEADIKAFKTLNSLFYLGHVHGNNCAGIKDGIPEVIECTYIRKDCLSSIPEIDFSPYPIEHLDFPNNLSKPDYPLNYWHPETRKGLETN